jgi:hypothetical protein
MNYSSTQIYKCPKCSQLMANDSIMSGNTFLAILYSDGKFDAPMLPEFPNFVKCTNCQIFFWLNKLKVFYSCYDFDSNETYKSTSMATFCTIAEYLEALNGAIAYDVKEELWLRNQLWHAFNDRIRANEPVFQKEDDEPIYFDNCKKIIEMLDEADYEKKILIAELYRNLGNFEKCIAICTELAVTDIENLSNQIKSESEKKNQWVIILKAKNT